MPHDGTNFLISWRASLPALSSMRFRVSMMSSDMTNLWKGRRHETALNDLLLVWMFCFGGSKPFAMAAALALACIASGSMNLPQTLQALTSGAGPRPVGAEAFTLSGCCGILMRAGVQTQGCPESKPLLRPALALLPHVFQSSYSTSRKSLA